MFIVTRILSILYNKTNLIKDDYSDYIPQIPISDRIPQRVNLIYLTTEKDSRLPEVFEQNIRNLKQLNQDWEFYLYQNDNAESFITEFYGERILQYYKRISEDYLAVKADFLRYLIQYSYGGLYIDIKSTLTQPISSNIKDNRSLFVFRWPEIEVAETPIDIKGQLYINSIFISNAGNLSFRNLVIDILRGIDKYNPFTDGIGWGGVMALTGPWAFSRNIINFSKKNLSECEIVNFHDRNWGLVNNILGNSLVIDHKKMKMNDYRKSYKPIIINSNRFLQKVSELWLYLMTCKRK